MSKQTSMELNLGKGGVCLLSKKETAMTILPDRIPPVTSFVFTDFYWSVYSTIFVHHYMKVNSRFHVRNTLYKPILTKSS